MKRFICVATASAAGIFGVTYASKKKSAPPNQDEKKEEINVIGVPKVYARSCREEGPFFTSRCNEIMRHGYPGLDNLRCFRNYVMSYNPQTRIANWVCEHVTDEEIQGCASICRNNNCCYPEDQIIHPCHRSKHTDLSGTCYNYGHLADPDNHGYSQETANETYLMSNIVPQKGIGLHVFAQIARNKLTSYKNVFSYTGPVFMPKNCTDMTYEVIGQEKKMAVPTHFFKVIACEDTIGKFHIQAYLWPNEDLPEQNFDRFLVPMNMIEKATGLTFLDKLPMWEVSSINTPETCQVHKIKRYQCCS